MANTHETATMIALGVADDFASMTPAQQTALSLAAECEYTWKKLAEDNAYLARRFAEAVEKMAAEPGRVDDVTAYSTVGDVARNSAVYQAQFKALRGTIRLAAMVDGIAPKNAAELPALESSDDLSKMRAARALASFELALTGRVSK